MSKMPGHRFREFVQSFDCAGPRLPAMHTTLGRRFIHILDNGVIKPDRLDETLGKKTSFHFYGKPSYRPPLTDSYSVELASCLFCLILDVEALPPPSSLLPFDSGGYRERVAPLVGDLDLEDYFLAPTREQPGCFVSAFFGSNDAYINMRLRTDVRNEIRQFDLHSEAVVRLCSPNGNVRYDQRALSVELHYDDEIRLDRNTLLAIVAPDIAAENDELIAFAALREADLISYVVDLEEPAFRQRQVREAAIRWLGDNGYLDSCA